MCDVIDITYHNLIYNSWYFLPIYFYIIVTQRTISIVLKNKGKKKFSVNAKYDEMCMNQSKHFRVRPNLNYGYCLS